MIKYPSRTPTKQWKEIWCRWSKNKTWHYIVHGVDKNRKIRNSDLPVPEKFYSFDVELLFQFKLSLFKCFQQCTQCCLPVFILLKCKLGFHIRYCVLEVAFTIKFLPFLFTWNVTSDLLHSERTYLVSAGFHL